MGCTKQLSIAAGGDSFTPLHSAVYVTSTQQILGTSENYICRFNAETGAYISQTKAKPVYGWMHLGLVNGLPFLSTWNEKEQMNNSSTHALRDLFPVNAATLAIGTGLGWSASFEPANTTQWMGPGTLLGVGNRVYAFEQAVGAINYIDSTNPLLFATSGYKSDMINSFGASSNRIYCPKPITEQIEELDLSLALVNAVNTPTHLAVATEWVSHSNPAERKCYAVEGTKWLIRVDNFATDSKTYIDLDGLTGQTNVNPMRLRFNGVDDLLYIPCQAKNAVIVYDPAAGTAVWKTGFDSPVDVVFTTMTDAKKFAVQSGLAGLREIT